MTMNHEDERIYNRYIGIRAPHDFLQRIELFTSRVGRSKSQVCRYLLARCLAAYESDTDAIAKIRQEIL